MAGPIRALYLGGSSDTRTLLRTWVELERGSPTIETVATPEKGLDRLERLGGQDYRSVDCAVVDGGDEEVDPLGLVDEVRDRRPDVPVLVHAERDDDAFVAEVLSRDGTDYVRKRPGTDRFDLLARRIETLVADQVERRDEGTRDAREGNRDHGDADDGEIPRRYRDYERIVQTVEDPMYVTDEVGTLEMVNDAFVEEYGFTREELVGSNIVEFIPSSETLLADAQELIREILSDETDTESGTLLFEGRRGDGTWGVAEANQSVLYDENGQYAGVAGVLRDVTERERRTKELRQYRHLVETVGDPMYRLDHEGTITMVNDAMVRLLGYEKSELEGAHVSKILTPEAVAAGEETIRELAADPDRVAGKYEMDLETAEGWRTVEDKIALLQDDDGTVVGSVGVVRDVTERKRREQDLAHFEAIVETVPVGLFSLDEDGVITWANDEFYERMNMTQDELVGMEYLELVRRGIYDDEVVTDYYEYVRTLLSSDNGVEKINHEVDAYLPPDDEHIVVDAHTALLPLDEDGEYQGTVNAFRDITKRVEYERELERQNERLDRFASLVSHDLRNPLTVAMGHLEEAKVRDDDARALEEVDFSLERMETLVENLLLLARQGESVGDREPVSLQSVTTNAWATVDTDGATLQVEDTVDVDADPARLRQLFENLFRNAVEHVGKDVSVRIGTLGGGFYVEDDGPGIPEDRREELLAFGTTTTDEGTGFGLGIVSEIVDAHGWQIRIVDGSEGGARFEVVGDGDPVFPRRRASDR